MLCRSEINRKDANDIKDRHSEDTAGTGEYEKLSVSVILDSLIHHLLPCMECLNVESMGFPASR